MTHTILHCTALHCVDITQMPVLPYSLRAIHQHARDPTHAHSLLREFLPSLVRYFDWWRATRDLGDGLVVAIHNWYVCCLLACL
jgi:hypothetical protein